jgi:hypothetical protein
MAKPDFMEMMKKGRGKKGKGKKRGKGRGKDDKKMTGRY